MRWHTITIHTFSILVTRTCFMLHHTGETLPPFVDSVPTALALLITMPFQALHAQVCLLDLFHPISCNRSNQLNCQWLASPCYPEEPWGQMYVVQEAKTQHDAAAQCAHGASEIYVQFIKAVAHHANCAWDTY